MKLVHVQDVKHPISLYLYDTPGNISDIKETAAMFPNIDIVFLVFNGDIILDKDFQSDERVNIIQEYKKYATDNLKRYRKMPSQIQENQLIGTDTKKVIPSPPPNDIEERKGNDLDESAMTPLHSNGKPKQGSEINEEIEKYPKFTYIFTHKDKIKSKGIYYEGESNRIIEDMIKNGIISKSNDIISSKSHTDVHVLFKNEIQLKARADVLFKT